MNPFALTSLAAGAVQTTEWHPTPRHRAMDSASATVIGRMTVEAMRAKYPEGKRFAVGQGFFLMSADLEELPGGFVRAQLELQGLFTFKKWGQPTSQSLRRELTNVDVRTTPLGGVGAVADQSFAKLASTESQAGYILRVLDNLAPDYKKVGKAHTAPYAGLTFPPLSQTDNPWDFWGTYVPTRNEPYGWVLTSLEGEELGDVTGQKLYDKTYTFTWLWEQVP